MGHGRKLGVKLASMSRITAGVILVQIGLVGLVTFDYIGPLIHVVWGIIAFLAAIVAGVVTLRSKPTDGGLRGVSTGLIFAMRYRSPWGSRPCLLEATYWHGFILWSWF